MTSLSPDSLQVWMAEGRPVVLLDTRSRDAYDVSHLPGAVPAESRTVSELRAVLPLDPQTPVVVYDEDGIPDPEQHDVAFEAADIYGFAHVHRLEGGLAAWRTRGFNLDGTAAR